MNVDVHGEGTGRVVITVTEHERHCEYSQCRKSLAGRDARARHCDAACRRAASRERNAAGGRENVVQMRAHGLASSGSDTPGAENKRRRRSKGPIASDKRVSYPAAVVACTKAIREVARVPEHDARLIAERYLSEALPPAQRPASARTRVERRAAA